MDGLARATPGERADVFIAATDKRQGIPAAIMEKDFWVCWALRRIFTFVDLPLHLIFKGGTSLSKAFRLIDRFSEDVDLSFDRRELGFDAARDPEKAPSGKRQRTLLDELQVECETVIRERLVPALLRDFEAILGPPMHRAGGWHIEVDPEDPQAVTFRYPPALAAQGIALPAYVPPAVCLELGARSDSWPSRIRTIAPYAAELCPRMFKTGSCEVNTLEAARTFWEKATLLHAESHRTTPGSGREQVSRHYFDLFQLSKTDVVDDALKRLDLLERVIEHKTVFFRSAWAHYATARPGGFRLLPSRDRAPALRRDYERMKVMIFGEPPTWDEIVEGLADLERRINGL
mgnify:CR=1 FL=1|jgi:hypothetical protein